MLFFPVTVQNDLVIAMWYFAFKVNSCFLTRLIDKHGSTVILAGQMDANALVIPRSTSNLEQ